MEGKECRISIGEALFTKILPQETNAIAILLKARFEQPVRILERLRDNSFQAIDISYNNFCTPKTHLSWNIFKKELTRRKHFSLYKHIIYINSNQLQHKVISENTGIVFPNTPAKLREYQELVVKSFYLANADVKQTATMIRTVVKTRDIFVDEKINLLVIKDTPSAIRLAEQLIAAPDLAEPEVMLEVEVLEVGYNRLARAGAEVSRLGGLGPDRLGRRPGRPDAPGVAQPRLGAGAANLSQPAVPAQPAPAGRQHQRARQSADPRQEQGEGQDPHRRSRAGEHHHNTQDNSTWESYAAKIRPLDWQLESGDRVTVAFLPQGDRPPEEFDLADDVLVAPGEYNWTRYSLGVRAAEKRRVSGELQFEGGSYYNGDLTTIEARLTLRPWALLNLDLTVERNDGTATDTTGATVGYLEQLYGIRGLLNFSPNLQFSSLTQYDTESREIGANNKLRWTFNAYGDLFVVYNHNGIRSEDSTWLFESNQLPIKVQYTWRF